MSGGFLLILMAALGQPPAEMPPAETPERVPPALKDADRIYAAEFVRASEGVHPHQDLLFVVAELELTEDAPKHVWHGRGMVRAQLLLRRYVLDRSLGEQPQRMFNPLLRQDPQLLEICRRIDPAFALPPLKYKVAARVLDDRKTDQRYRYVMVLSRSEFDGQLPQEPPALPDLSATLTCLRHGLDHWRRQGDGAQIAALMFRLGAVEEGLRAVNDDSAFDFPLASYGPLSLDSLQVFARYREAEAELQRGEPSDRRVAGMLRELPGLPAALAWVADRYRRREAWPAAVNASLLAMAGAADRPAGAAALQANLAAWCEAEKDAPARAEYRELVQRWLEAEPPAAFAGKEADVRHAERVWRSFGHLNMPAEKQGRPAAGKTGASAPGAGEEALPARLRQAAARPADARSWHLLGQALQAQQHPLPAVACYHQALRLDLQHAEARLNLALAYQGLGFPALARGAAVAALLAADESWPAAPQARAFLEPGKPEAAGETSE